MVKVDDTAFLFICITIIFEPAVITFQTFHRFGDIKRTVNMNL